MVEINLLPKQYRQQSQPSVWKYATYALLPITAAAILIPYLMASTQTNDLENQIGALNGDITTLTPGKQRHDELVKQQSDLEKVTTVAQTLKSGKTYWSNDLATFSAQMPTASGVALKSLSMRPVGASGATAQNAAIYAGKPIQRELELTGNATSQQSIINFLNTYESNSNFGVNFKDMKRDEQTGLYTFSATVGMVGTPAASTTNADGTPVPAGGTATPAAAPAAAPATTGGNNVR